MKKFLIICLTLVMMFCLCACDTDIDNTAEATLTYVIDTGDIVIVKLDTTDSEYILVPNNDMFLVYDGDLLITQGRFISYDEYKEAKTAAKVDEASTVIKETTTKIFYVLEDEESTEYDLVMKLNNKTGVLIGSYLDDEITIERAESIMYRFKFEITE